MESIILYIVLSYIAMWGGKYVDKEIPWAIIIISPFALPFVFGAAMSTYVKDKEI